MQFNSSSRGIHLRAVVAVLDIVLLFGIVALFWALFDQHSSTWVLQAQTIDLQVGKTSALSQSSLN